MNPFVMIGYVAGVLGFLAFIVAAIVVVRSTASKTTIDQQKELIDVLTSAKAEQKEQYNDLQKKHTEAMNAISNLQGQVDVLKNIPLVNIDSTLKQLSKFSESLAKSNEKILERLDASAVILKTNTKAAAEAVSDVKQDLKRS